VREIHARVVERARGEGVARTDTCVCSSKMLTILPPSRSAGAESIVTGGIVLLPHESSISIPSPCPSPGGRGNAYPHARRSRSSVLPSRADMLLDRAQDALGVGEEFVVGETEHQDAARGQERIASHILGRRWEVRRAVSFHRELRIDAEEVDDEAPDRVLPSELRIGDRSPPKRRPQALLGRRRGCPKCASSICR